jgi:LPXTG-motif cell wall-anchored protein
VLLIAVIAIPASADERNKKTTITFNAPVAVPGMVLPAGTYVFRLLESATNRNIVVVYNAEETHAYTMILAIPNYRLRPVDEPVLRFKEGLRGAPDALHAWFFSGDQWGQEFVYPKTEAALIAENTGERVLEAEITPEETPEALTETHVAVMTPQKEEEEFYSEEVAEALATPTLIETPPVERAAVTAVEEELPKTAGNLPLVALLGFSSLALAGLLNFKRKTR